MVASIAMWSMRASQDDIDVYEAYAMLELIFQTTQETMFSLKVNYAGCFTESPGRSYVNGDFAYLDCIDIDEFSVHELNDMVKKIGFSGKNIMYYSFLKPDISLDNGLYALGNDEDVRRMAEYIRLGYKMIEVFIEHDKTIVFTYIDAAYNTPKHKCLIMEIPEGVSPKNAPVSKMKPRRPVSGFCAKKLLLGCKQNDANVIGESSSRHEDGHSDGDTSECSKHDKFVDTDNDLVDVKVDMDHFDTSNAKTIGNDGTPEFKLMKNLILALMWSAKGAFFVGQEFPNSAIVKDLVHRHSIETRRELYLKKNDKVRVRAACKGTIPVFTTSCDIGPSKVVESSQTQRGESSQPTKWTKGKIANNKGVESPLNKSKKVGGKPTLRKVAANQCPCVLQVSKLQDSETWQVKTFDDTHKCLQSRKIKYFTADFLSEDIIDQIETNPEIPIKAIQEQLQRKFQLELRDYVMELQQSNPNTTIRIRVESEADHMKPTRVFKRIYVYLGAAKEGFKACMRHFLGFDGTFMKGPFPGQLLTAVGVDPNNGIYPLAYGIVETESRDSWTWFLQHLKEDLDLQDNSNFTFISDRQKGIIPAIAELFSAVEHSQLVDGRDRPIISTLEYAIEYLMKRIVNDKQVIERSDGPLTPTATRLFNVIKAEASQCIANFNEGSLYGVTGQWGEVCVVDVQNRTDTWKQVYSHHINPIRGKIMWPNSPIPTTILPPNHHPQVSRPPKNRKKSAGEDIQMVKYGNLSRKSKTVTCMLCNSKGHNKRSCTGLRKDACNKGSTSNAGKKRPRSETTTRTSQVAKKPNNVAVGVQTRSKATNKGNQPTAAAKKPVNKGKKKV
ncbi:mutator type transposase [Tanacetum coccineum]|uniref:Mutator type transposase n=1 Tax=Tanacetum coccineum TaxID=301880 RepID=A0ABQ5HK98_9ASTR